MTAPSDDRSCPFGTGPSIRSAATSFILWPPVGRIAPECAFCTEPRPTDRQRGERFGQAFAPVLRTLVSNAITVESEVRCEELSNDWAGERATAHDRGGIGYSAAGRSGGLRLHVRERAAAAWRTMLTGSVEDGRQLFREILVGPIRFTPEKGAKLVYRFEGELAFERLFGGSRTCTLYGVPSETRGLLHARRIGPEG